MSSITKQATRRRRGALARARKPAAPRASESRRSRPRGMRRWFRRSGAVPLLQAGMGGDGGKAAERAGTRFVCPFCPVSHRVPGPGARIPQMRRAQWVKLRRVEE